MELSKDAGAPNKCSKRETRRKRGGRGNEIPADFVEPTLQANGGAENVGFDGATLGRGAGGKRKALGEDCALLLLLPLKPN